MPLRTRLRLTPVQGITALAVLLAGSTALSRCDEQPSIKQPIAFNHALHVVQEQMACVACHEDAWTRPHAGLPGITICAGCHQEPLGDHPEEDKLTSYVMSRKEIPFVQVNRYPGHVYFSHRAHVALGEMDCATCHAEVPTMTLPHARPAASRHSMEDCMACHRQAGATLECLACHK